MLRTSSAVCDIPESAKRLLHHLLSKVHFHDGYDKIKLTEHMLDTY